MGFHVDLCTFLWSNLGNPPQSSWKPDFVLGKPQTGYSLTDFNLIAKRCFNLFVVAGNAHYGWLLFLPLCWRDYWHRNVIWLERTKIDCHQLKMLKVDHLRLIRFAQALLSQVWLHVMHRRLACTHVKRSCDKQRENSMVSWQESP